MSAAADAGAEAARAAEDARRLEQYLLDDAELAVADAARTFGVSEAEARGALMRATLRRYFGERFLVLPSRGAAEGLAAAVLGDLDALAQRIEPGEACVVVGRAVALATERAMGLDDEAAAQLGGHAFARQVLLGALLPRLDPLFLPTTTPTPADPDTQAIARVLLALWIQHPLVMRSPTQAVMLAVESADRVQLQRGEVWPPDRVGGSVAGALRVLYGHLFVGGRARAVLREAIAEAGRRLDELRRAERHGHRERELDDAEIAALEREVERLEAVRAALHELPDEEHAAVYAERNLAARAACRLATWLGWPAGVYDDPATPGWSVVSVWLPGGEVTWHVPSGEAEGLPRVPRCWDGHSARERDERLRAFVAQAPPREQLLRRATEAARGHGAAGLDSLALERAGFFVEESR